MDKQTYYQPFLDRVRHKPSVLIKAIPDGLRFLRDNKDEYEVEMDRFYSEVMYTPTCKVIQLCASSAALLQLLPDHLDKIRFAWKHSPHKTSDADLLTASQIVNVSMKINIIRDSVNTTEIKQCLKALTDVKPKDIPPVALGLMDSNQLTNSKWENRLDAWDEAAKILDHAGM